MINKIKRPIEPNPPKTKKPFPPLETIHKEFETLQKEYHVDNLDIGLAVKVCKERSLSLDGLMIEQDWDFDKLLYVFIIQYDHRVPNPDYKEKKKVYDKRMEGWDAEIAEYKEANKRYEGLLNEKISRV